MKDGGSVHAEENPKQNERRENEQTAYLAASLAAVRFGLGGFVLRCGIGRGHSWDEGSSFQTENSRLRRLPLIAKYKDAMMEHESAAPYTLEVGFQETDPTITIC
jgi:hypothetical protein